MPTTMSVSCPVRKWIVDVPGLRPFAAASGAPPASAAKSPNASAARSIGTE